MPSQSTEVEHDFRCMGECPRCYGAGACGDAGLGGCYECSGECANSPDVITESMIKAAGEAMNELALKHLGRDLGTLHRDDIAQFALSAAMRARHR